MKILLIEPHKSKLSVAGEDIHIFEPLALEYIAAGVTDDHEVKILDLRLEKKMETTLRDFNPDIVGITAYTVHVNTVKKLFDEIKIWNPDVLTVVGGHHATIVPEDFNLPSIDVIIMGEGVTSFKELVKRFKDKKDFSGIKGVAFKHNGKLIKNDPDKNIELDSLPFPRRDLTLKYREYYFSEWMRPLASIRTSKGCPYKCSFCALWKISGGKYFKRSPEKIVEELSGIKEEFIFFADDESLVDVARMKKLAVLIKEAGIKKRYFLYGRSNTIAENPDLIKLWKEIGLERVFVGLEFFRDEDLKYIRKNSTVCENEKAIKTLQSFGIDLYASFILRQEFSKKDFKELREYIRKLNLNFAAYALLTPFPGTDLLAEVEDKLLTKNYDYFDLIHTLLPTKLSIKEFYREYAKLFRIAIPYSKGFAFLRKYPLKEILPTLGKSFKFNKRLLTIHRDYN